MPATPTPDAPTPLIIAHRGASGYRPEHTLAAYELAVRQGADYIECDLVMTRDSVLVARHENEIGATTDAGTRFPGRRRTRVIDGDTVTGWFVEDLTLAELKTLRARERIPSRGSSYDGQFEIPTFDEVLALLARASQEVGRPVGIYPETKHPSYHESRGLPITAALLEALHRAGYRDQTAPVFIQSFEPGNLRRLQQRTRLRLVQLVDAKGRPADFTLAGDLSTYADLVTPDGLRKLATYAAAIGAPKQLILPVHQDGTLGTPTSLVADAHAAGLEVHVWTFRADAPHLPAAYQGDALAEFRRFRELGVDAVFTDYPDLAVRALRQP